jgi:hypothetical protein
VLFLMAGCSGSQKVEQAQPQAQQAQGDTLYVPPGGGFTIKVPKPPEIRGYGNAPKDYTFYGLDMKAAGPLLTIRESPIPPPNATGAPLRVTPERFEQSYRAEPGALVNGKEISVGDYSGREIDIVGGRRAPLVIRIFDAHDMEYWLEWNPTIARSTQVADTFAIP